MAQLVEAMHNETGGRGFDSRRGHWDFLSDLAFLSACSGPWVHTACNRSGYQSFAWGKGGCCIKLKTLPPSCPRSLSRPV